MINGISSFTSQFRLSGLASGLDTDQLVKNLMMVERIPLDKLMQKKQLTEWKRDAYRSITTLLRGFQSEYFDILKPATNMRSQSIYQKYTSVSSSPDTVTVTGGSAVTSLSHKIIVNRVASAANAESTDFVSKSLIGGEIDSFTVDSFNKSFMLNVNGVSKVITLKEGTYADADALLGNGSDGLLLQKVKEAFSNVDVVVNNGALEFKTANKSDVVTVSSNLVVDNMLSTLKVNSKGEGSKLTFPLTVEANRRLTVSATVDGTVVKKEIKWPTDRTYNNSTDLAADLQLMLDTEFGAGKIIVDGTDDKLTFKEGTGVDSVTLENSYKNDKILASLGFSSGASNKLSLTDSLETISSKLLACGLTFVDGKLNFTINGKDIELNSKDTLKTLIDKVNSSNAGVTMSYSSFTDKFTLVSKTTGAGTITLDDKGSNFFAAIGLTNVVEGQDASFILDGLEATRSSNSFAIDGIVYNLKKADPGVEVKISLSRDTDAVYNTIKGFVDKYNEIISTINSKLSEKYDRDYPPLTDTQKADMSEEEIERWEEKAKTGLLRNDSILSSIVTKMRRAMYDSIKGVSGSLFTIGITTGSYDENGKLIIDETKLREAISNNPDLVMNIFSKESSISYSPDLSPTDRATRYNESGIINRIYDILQDNIRTTRNKNDQKGILLEKAGMPGDATDIKNLLYYEIHDYELKIDDLTDRLTEKEEYYYSKFTAMEKALAQMNNQSSWIAAQLGRK